jgi:hypothetical protein
MLDKSGYGNHAFQATSGLRPVLSARYNLFTKTEQFDNAVWQKLVLTITANNAIAPDGTQTADKVIATPGDLHIIKRTVLSTAQSHTFSIYAKAAELPAILLYNETIGTGRLFDISNGTVGVAVGAAPTNSSIISVGAGWYKVSITATTTVASNGWLVYLAANSGTNGYVFTGDNVSGIYIWGASLVPTSQSNMPYQRVNTDTDYNTIGFLPYLKFDGVDDSLSTNSINFTSTDKMSVFAGVRKLSDAARGMIVELSATSASNNGSFGMTAPNAASATYAFESKGTSLTDAIGTPFAAPLTSVLCGLTEISTDSNILRVNGVQADSDAGDQGTGNYGDYSLYIGSRGGTSLPFNGQIYSMIVVGRGLAAIELSLTEACVNGKTGAY